MCRSKASVNCLHELYTSKKINGQCLSCVCCIPVACIIMHFLRKSAAGLKLTDAVCVSEDAGVYLAVFLFLMSALLVEMVPPAGHREMRAAAYLCPMQSWSAEDSTDR